MKLSLYRLSEGGRVRENYFIDPYRGLRLSLPKNGYRGSRGRRRLVIGGLSVQMEYRREVLDDFSYIEASVSIDPPPERLIEVVRDGDDVRARLLDPKGARELEVRRDAGARGGRMYVVVEGMEVDLLSERPSPRPRPSARISSSSAPSPNSEALLTVPEILPIATSWPALSRRSRSQNSSV